MHPEVAELAGLIEQAAELLLAHGETHWASWLRVDAQRIRNLDLFGVEHMLSAYGGMGSINDLILHPQNGHSLEESEVEATNDRLRRLLGRIDEGEDSGDGDDCGRIGEADTVEELREEAR